MYAFIEGRLEDPGPPTVISCGGVGYELWLPERHRLRLGHRGDELRVYTHLHSREDGMTLYGFASPAEREFFRSLLGVSGVGPKLALAVLGDEDAEAILTDIKRGDARSLTRIKGVGKKTAERLVVELKDKDVEWGGTVAVQGVEPGSPEEEAALALVAMGLTHELARSALSKLDPEERQGVVVEELVRRALQRVGP